MRFVRVIDTETTGTDPETDRVVEIGWVDVDLEARKILRPWSTLVFPGRGIPPEAMAVHHITDAMVRDKPRLSEVIGKALSFGTHVPDAFVAHNAAFDQGFLPQLQSQNWICTYKIALRIWPLAPKHSNQVLRYWRGHLDCVPEHLVHAHRVLYDVHVTAALFLDMLSLARTPDPLEGMIQVTREPVRLPFCTIGKHKGKSWDMVPTDYLQWMLRAEEMSNELVVAAQRELERRADGGRHLHSPHSEDAHV